MALSRKKVIVRRFSTGFLAGYLPQSGFVRQNAGDPVMDLLDLSGRVLSLPLSDIKMASYVRDFNSDDLREPERLLRKTFLARPRSEGLWLRIGLRDEDLIEGLAPIDLSLADNFTEDLGVQITPPDVRSNTQKIYIPRSSMTSLQMIAVVTTPSRKKPLPRPAVDDLQEDLFSLELPPNARTH